MKLVRYGEKGREKPGVIDENDILRDAAAMADDWRGAFLSDNFLSQVRAADLPPADISGGFPRLGVPVATIGKIIGIGLNYRAHAAEAGMSPPEDPIIFLKSPDAANGPHDDIALPRGSTKTDWEIELAVVFGKDGKYISEKKRVFACRRLLHRKRCFRTRISIATRSAVDERKKRGHFRPARSMDCNARRNSRTAKFKYVAVAQRRNAATRKYRRYGFSARRIDCARFRIYDDSRRRCDDYRHAARRGIGGYAAAIFAPRR